MYLSSFIYEEDSRLFLTGSRPEFSYSDGIETEDYLLNVVTSVKDKGIMSQELKGWIKDWPTRYHLSSSRSNLLRPFSFLDKSMDVLELGAGCGALTRYLGEKCGSVDAVEGSYIRAKIARERCSDLENVKVYVDNFFNLSFDKGYDVVTLVGVLEYAPLFCPTKFENSEDACLELFKLATKAVKDDGIIILAIENKLGLKYWAGCKEDHTGKVSEGLHGYPNTSCQHAGPVTFSKKELENMIRQCGLPEIDFYYPFPDYKLPNTIIKEDADYSPADLFLYNWVTTPFEDYTGDREYKFHEALALKNITKAGLFGEFANSFLILAGKSKKHDVERRWVAKRFSTERKPRYATVTTLYSEPELTINKELLYGTKQLDGYKGPIFLKELLSKWQPGELLSFDFYEAILLDDDPMGQIDKLILSYHNKLLDVFSVGKKDEEGYPLLRGDSIDYVPWNILVHEGQWFYIDDEWEYQGLLPIDYVMFRFLYNFIYLQNEYMRINNLLGTDTDDFILKVIQQIYSHYDWHRNETNQHREEQFQEMVYTSSTDSRLSRLIIEKQRLEKRLNNLEILLIDKKEEVEKLLQQKEEVISNNQRDINEKESQLDLMRQQATENEQNLICIKEENESLKSQLDLMRQQATENEQNLTSQFDSIRLEKLSLEHRFSQLQNQLFLMESALGWRIIKKYRSIMDRLFPAGTKRQRLYELSQKTIKFLFRFGFRNLMKKTREKCAIRRFRRMNLIGIKVPQSDLPLLYQEKKSVQVGFNPKVTVIVPNYNHANFLRQRLETIYNQTYRNFEVILLDDASRDESRQILVEYQQRFPEITRCCFNEVNSGGAFYQWRRGIKMAHGDLIWIAESDDYCSKNLLSDLVSYFANEAVMLAYCRSVFVDREASKQVWSIEEYLVGLHPDLWLKPFVISAHSLVNKAWAIQNIVPNVSSAVFRNPEKMELLDNEDWQRMRICGDWIFYLNLVRGGLVAYTPHATNYFRIHQNNTSVSTYSKDIYYQEHEIVAKELLKLYRLKEDVFERQRQMLESHWRSYRTDYSEKSFKECYNYERIRHLSEQRKPNILMASFALAAGGGETFPIKLANLLKVAGYGITFLNCYQAPTEPGVRRMLRRDIPLLEIDVLEKLDVVANDMGIELVHSHHASIDTNICRIMKDNPNIQLIVTTHGLYEMIPSAELIQLAPLLRRVDKFVYTADKNLAAFNAENFDMDRFVKIENALDIVQISPVPRSELNVPEHAFLLCLVSRAIPEKGWQEAIEAVKLAREISERQIHLLLIGEGPEYDRLKPIIKDNYIHFLGFRENVRDYFAASDLGFLPSRFPGESFPLVIIECFHANRPMLASNVGEIARMMLGSYGQAGTVFDLENWEIPIDKVAGIIATYAQDKNLYLDHLSRVSAAAAKFDPRVLLNKYEAVYQELFRGAGKRPDVCAVGINPPVHYIKHGRQEAEPFDSLILPRNEKRILIIDQNIPTFDQDSGSLRMYSILKIITELNYIVTFIPNDLKYTEPYYSELKKIGIEIINDHITPECYLKEKGGEFSVVILSRADVAFKYLPLIRAYAINSKVIYDTVDLHWIRYQRATELHNSQDMKKKADYYKNIETINTICSDVTFTVTDDDKKYLLEAIPEANVEVVPNVHEVEQLQNEFSNRQDLMFIGGFYHEPNVDAILYFVKEIYPSIIKKLPGVRLYVVGSNPPDVIKALDGPDIKVTGFLKDVKPIFQSCRVFVSPLRYGAGMKGKIGQSMAFGLPVVTTSIGAEGIGLSDGQNALIADEPQEFAEAVAKLYTDENLWNEMSKNSIDHINRRYSPDVIRNKMENILQSLQKENGSKEADLLSGKISNKNMVEEMLPSISDNDPKGKVLIAGVYLSDKQNNIGHIIEQFDSTRNWNIVHKWISLGSKKNCDQDHVERVTTLYVDQKRPKFTLINELLSGENLKEYDYIIISDDDIVMPCNFLDLFLAIQKKYDFAIAQPARTHNSYIDHPFVEKLDGLQARRTRFVEIGPLVSFRQDAFLLLFPFDQNSPMGWGYDFVWPRMMDEHGLRMGIIDAVPVEHSMRKPVVNYKHSEAMESMNKYLTINPHVSPDEAFTILESYA